MKPLRFTLRKEYFGGLVHDAKTMAVELLTPNEYEFLIAVAKKTPLPSCDKSRVETFINKKFIGKTGQSFTANDLRIVLPPKHIHPNVLTAPIRIFDSYTRQCNFQCPQCYFSSSAFVKENRRTLEETKTIIQKFYDAGTMEWRFTGGEALIHKDVDDAVAFAKSLGMNVGIYSNGWWVEETANRVFSMELDEITFSLEGSPEVNDKRRRIGGYKKVLNSIKRVYNYNKKNPEKRIQGIIASAIGKDNVQDVPYLAHLAAEYGFTINFMPLKPSGRARYTLTDEMLNSEEYKEFAQTVQSLRNDPFIKKSGIKIVLKYKDLFCDTAEDKSSKPFPFNYAECGALTKYLSMMPDGQVFSCPFVLDVDPQGNYLGPNMIITSVEDAWNHPHFTAYRNAEKVGCSGCKFFMKQCRGKCRATVLGFGGKIEHGKLFGDDPQCFSALM